MAEPILKIAGVDYTEYVESMEPTRNDLDADGSGRDVTSGAMFRTRITDKLQWQIKMLRMPEDKATALQKAMQAAFFQATTLDPRTNTQRTLSYYTASVPFGAQVYDRYKKKVYYDGLSFQITEK